MYLYVVFFFFFSPKQNSRKHHCVMACPCSCAKRDNGVFSFWLRFSTFHLSSEVEAVMQSNAGEVLFCYSDSTVKINIIFFVVFVYNLYYSKRINVLLSCMKAGNYLLVCAFAVCLVLEAFAFLLRNPISCPGL